MQNSSSSSSFSWVFSKPSGLPSGGIIWKTGDPPVRKTNRGVALCYISLSLSHYDEIWPSLISWLIQIVAKCRQRLFQLIFMTFGANRWILFPDFADIPTWRLFLRRRPSSSPRFGGASARLLRMRGARRCSNPFSSPASPPSWRRRRDRDESPVGIE